MEGFSTLWVLCQHPRGSPGCYTCARYHCGWKIRMKHEENLCIISHNCMWTYSFLKLKKLHQLYINKMLSIYFTIFKVNYFYRKYKDIQSWLPRSKKYAVIKERRMNVYKLFKHNIMFKEGGISIISFKDFIYKMMQNNSF